MPTVTQNLNEIRARLARAAEAACRAPDSVTLVAASKHQPEAGIVEAIAQGHRVFGENRVQEAKTKWPPIRKAFPGLRLHLIGPLQTNKTREAVALFDVIETLDRPRLADLLAAEEARSGRKLEYFLQVNIGGEAQKHGCAPEEAAPLLRHARAAGLSVTGLMAIPPAGASARSYFEALRDLAMRQGLTKLSMGMSADFEEAIACGATHVRVGSGIFGTRA